MLADGTAQLSPNMFRRESLPDDLLQICKECSNAKLEWVAAIKGLGSPGHLGPFTFQTPSQTSSDVENQFATVLSQSRTLDMDLWRRR